MGVACGLAFGGVKGLEKSAEKDSIARRRLIIFRFLESAANRLLDYTFAHAWVSHVLQDPVHGRLHPLVVGVVDSPHAALHIKAHGDQLHQYTLVHLHCSNSMHIPYRGCGVGVVWLTHLLEEEEPNCLQAVPPLLAGDRAPSGERDPTGQGRQSARLQDNYGSSHSLGNRTQPTIFLWYPIFTKAELCHLQHEVLREGSKPQSSRVGGEMTTSDSAFKLLLLGNCLFLESRAVEILHMLRLAELVQTGRKGDHSSHCVIRVTAQRAPT